MIARENLRGFLRNGGARRVAACAVLVIFFIALLAGTQSCKKRYKEPEIIDAQITSFKLSGLTSAKFGIDAEVFNPNNFSFKIVGMEGVVNFQGVPLANFSSDDTFEVEKLSQKVYSAQILLSITNLDGVTAIVTNSDNYDLKGVTVDITANVRKAGVTVPVKRTGIPINKFFKNGLPFDKLF